MKHIRSLSITTTLTIWLITLLTILAEISVPFKNALAGVTGHHWTTKGVISLVFFFVIYVLLAKSLKDYSEPIDGTRKVVLSTVIGGIIILAFYFWHYVG